MRLKESWKPKVQELSRGDVTKTFFAGTDLDVLLTQKILVLDGQVVDAKVTLGRGAKQVHCRLCGVPVPDGSYRFYLTSLPPRVGPHQVADSCATREAAEVAWERGRQFKGLAAAGALRAPPRAVVHPVMGSQWDHHAAYVVVFRRAMSQARSSDRRP
jgi:hypothetical protein